MAEKLVRDLIPARDIAKGGKRSVFRNAAPEEMEGLLLAKIREEAEEVCSAPSAAALLLEMADLLEVLYALADTYGWTPEEIEYTRQGKAAVYGGLKFGIVLVTEDPKEK